MNKRQAWLADTSNKFKIEEHEARNGHNSQWTIALWAENEHGEWELIDNFRSYDDDEIALQLKFWKDTYNVLEEEKEPKILSLEIRHVIRAKRKSYESKDEYIVVIRWDNGYATQTKFQTMEQAESFAKIQSENYS